MQNANDFDRIRMRYVEDQVLGKSLHATKSQIRKLRMVDTERATDAR